MVKSSEFLSVLVTFALAGCSTLTCGDPHPYLHSVARPPLKAPPGLSVPAPDPAYSIPPAASSQGQRTDRDAAGACLINPPQVVLPQPAAVAQPKPGAVAPQGGSMNPAPEKAPPATKPAAKENTAAPSAATIVPPPSVAGPGRIR